MQRPGAGIVMSDGAKCIAVIPARGGSKRIPGKNIRDFCGKPLIAYSIETAINSKLFDDIIVSTDDDKIAKIALEYGASVPFIRPTELADDFTGTNAIVKHAIDWLRDEGRQVDSACCIYATAPLLRSEFLVEGYNKINNGWQYAFSVSTYDFPVQRALHKNDDDKLEAVDAVAIQARSQDLEELWHDAGQFYWGKADAFVNELPMTTGLACGITLPRSLVQDIDTEEDWREAEIRYRIINES